MLSTRERWAGAFVQAAPLLGIPIWALRLYLIDAAPHADYDGMGTFFASGLFMLAAGFIVALIARFASRFPFVREQAAGALRFQLWAAAASIVVLAAVPLAALTDGQPWTLDHQPVHFMAAITIAGFSYGIVLPLLEAGRAIVLTIRTLRP